MNIHGYQRVLFIMSRVALAQYVCLILENESPPAEDGTAVPREYKGLTSSNTCMQMK